MRHNMMALGQAEANNPAVTPEGEFALGGKVYVGKDYFVYSVLAENIATASAVTRTIQIQADSDFVWQKATFAAFLPFSGDIDPVDFADRQAPAATVQITDNGSGRQLFDRPQIIGTVFGTGQLPFIMPTPRLMVARSTINFEIANLAPSDELYLQLSLIGYKAYPRGA
jgi:hypothetical protein